MTRFVHYLIVGTLACSISSVLAIRPFGNGTVPQNLTRACTDTLLAEVDCTSTLLRLKAGSYYAKPELEKLCTPSCFASLERYAANIEKDCVDQTWDGYGADEMPVAVIPDLLHYELQRACITDSGRFCNNVAASAAYAANPSAKKLPHASIGGRADEMGNASHALDPCDLCFIKSLQFQAGSPFYNGPQLRAQSIYESKTKSCGVSTLPLATTSTLGFSLPAISMPTRSPCAGIEYSIQPGDTCYSISEKQSIGTGWLLTDNDLQAYCTGFPANGKLCLHNICKTYVVQDNDTCSGIAKGNNITQSQLIAYNPTISPGCYNIRRLVNSSVCVSSPGPQYQAPSSVSLAPLTATAAAPVPNNARELSNRECGMWYQVGTGDYCNMLVLKFGISLVDFVFLNPTINSNCTNLLLDVAYCVKPVGDINTYSGRAGSISTSSVASWTPIAMIPDGTISWEMAKPTEAPFADGTRQDCNFYFDGSSFQDPVPYFKSLCDFAAAIYSVKLADFGTWNKGLQIHESSCSFQVGKRYCGKLYFGEQTMSGVTSEDYPLRQGAAQDCIRYENAWPDRTCQDILDSQGITIDKFFALNPAVGADCGGLWPEYSYCVATPDSGDTTALSIDDSHTTKPSKAGPTTPVQIGQPSDCNKWYEVKSGDSCASIANQNGISVDIFYTWNPIVSKDCSTGFWTGYSYCVSTGGSQPQVQLSSTSDPTSTTATPPAPTPNQANNAISGCKTYALAQNGDYCAKFADRSGITSAQLYGWNSALGTDGSGCDNRFWAGYYYCVGV